MGRKINNNLDLRIFFGQYVQVRNYQQHDPENICLNRSYAHSQHEWISEVFRFEQQESSDERSME
jgi:hypothetical protein